MLPVPLYSRYRDKLYFHDRIFSFLDVSILNEVTDSFEFNFIFSGHFSFYILKCTKVMVD